MIQRFEAFSNCKFHASNIHSRELFLVTLVFLFAVALTSCVPKRYSAESRLLALRATTPLPNVPLRIINLDEATSFIQSTDTEGRFVLDKLKAGRYVIQSGDSTRYFVSPDTIVLRGDTLQVKLPPLRGIVAPPAHGVFAWVGGQWRELSAVKTSAQNSITTEVANRAMVVPASASLLVWYPSREWSVELEWWMASMTGDSLIRFIPGVAMEKIPMGEPAVMTPEAFPEWKLPGVIPLRGPSIPNLYAIAVKPFEGSDEATTIHPFWYPPKANDSPVATNNTTPMAGMMDTLQSILASNPQTAQINPDILRQAIQNATAMLQKLSPGNLLGAATGATPQATVAADTTPKNHSKTVSAEQAARWREQLRDATRDRDTLRRRMLFRAIRDSADGTDVGYQADRLLVRDLNGLPLR